jgi:hypothetical protein
VAFHLISNSNILKFHFVSLQELLTITIIFRRIETNMKRSHPIVLAVLSVFVHLGQGVDTSLPAGFAGTNKGKFLSFLCRRIIASFLAPF